MASSSRSSSGRREAFTGRPPARASARGGRPRVGAERGARRGERVAVGLEHDSVEPPVETEVREHRRRGLARDRRRRRRLGARRRAGGAALADRRIAAQLHAGVVAVEARELGAPVLDVGRRPSRRARGRRSARSLESASVVERADRLEAAGEMLDGGEPETLAAGREGVLAEDDRRGGVTPGGYPLRIRVRRHRRSAVIVTVGNELTSGDVEGSATRAGSPRRLESLGWAVRLVASLPDEVESIARLSAPCIASDADCVLVTGGLGGTPDDLTREAVAAAFSSTASLDERAAEPLRERFAERGLTAYTERWATLPRGAEPLGEPARQARRRSSLQRGRTCSPGVPAEMQRLLRVGSRSASRGRRRSMQRATAATPTSPRAIWPWRSPAFAEHFARRRRSGSYPSFDDGHREVELVLKSRDESLARGGASPGCGRAV